MPCQNDEERGKNRGGKENSRRGTWDGFSFGEGLEVGKAGLRVPFKSRKEQQKTQRGKVRHVTES